MCKFLTRELLEQQLGRQGADLRVKWCAASCRREEEPETGAEQDEVHISSPLDGISTPLSLSESFGEEN